MMPVVIWAQVCFSFIIIFLSLTNSFILNL
jgi:hypothetical protein